MSGKRAPPSRHLLATDGGLAVPRARHPKLPPPAPGRLGAAALQGAQQGAERRPGVRTDRASGRPGASQ
eukprot:4199492-Pyramimonas_sp.AAC.1